MAGNRSQVVLTAAEVAEAIGAEIVGSGDVTVSGVNVIERAAESELAFIGCERNLTRVGSSKARVIICPAGAQSQLASFVEKTFLFVAKPEVSFLIMAERLMPGRPRPKLGVSPHAIVADSAEIGEGTNVHPLAVVGEDVRIGRNCNIGSGAVIGAGSIIGDDVTIDANAVIYPEVDLGNQITIQACSVIGARGFGYRLVDGRHEVLPHVGNVRIADDVEIGACTTIDRAKVGETLVDSGTRIDNLVMIAHNCQIGPNNLIIGQAGIAGSSSTGAYVICAGQAGIADHVHLGDGAVVGAKTGVHRDMPGGKAYLGIPARDAGLHAREQMSLKRLPEMRLTVKQLEKQVAELQQQIAALMQASQKTPEQADIQRAA